VCDRVAVGDLEEETRVELVGEGRYRATLSAEWEIWGPMGGYVASIALRAAGEASPFDRPASFFCHYLGVAAFDVVDIVVTPIRTARTALAQRVEVTQRGKPILEATVWSIGDVEGLEHDEAMAPDVPGPDALRAIEELLTPEELDRGPAFPFWRNLDSKPVQWVEGPPTAPLSAVWQTWLRFTPTPTFTDPWVDACRSLILIDIQSWPAAGRPHVMKERRIYAPSLDLYVAFHDPHPETEWLLADGSAPVAKGGLMGWDGRLWSPDGRLVSSGAGQLLCRRMPGVAAG
jgi:acyl-CoA thioesterase-2